MKDRGVLKLKGGGGGGGGGGGANLHKNPLLYQHDSSRGYICGELNNFDNKNSQLLFCTGDLERSYAECHLGLLVCCSVHRYNT